jgi:hypothetical protein
MRSFYLVLCACLFGSSITTTTQADDVLAFRTKRLSELLRKYNAQAAASLVQDFSTLQIPTPPPNSIFGNGFRPLAAQTIVRNQLSELFRVRSAEIDAFSASLDNIAGNIQTLPESSAIDTLKSIAAPSIVKDVYSTTQTGQHIPDPPHVLCDPTEQESIADFVVGPGIATTVDYPSVAEINYNFEGFGFSTLCSGTVVSPTAILTAAHCFCDRTKSLDAQSCRNSTYKRGLINLSPLDKRYIKIFLQDVGSLDVDDVIIDQNYKQPRSDLAILKLSKPVIGIEPAEISFDAVVQPNSDGIIVGFGQHSQLTPSGDADRAISPIVNSQGLKLWANVITHKCSPSDAANGLICWDYLRSIGEEQLGSTCHGDSGGPLFMRLKDHWILAGVTSGGPRDCLPTTGNADIDIDLSKNSVWLKANISDIPPVSVPKTSFLCDRSNRAYSSRYKYFFSKADAWSDTFDLPTGIRQLQVSVNANPTFSKLILDLASPNGTAQSCSWSTKDAVATCTIDLPVTGEWKFSVSGSAPQETQVVGSVVH